MKTASAEDIANPGSLRSPVYVPGRPVADVARELGMDPAGIVKLASNENPLGPGPKATEAVRRVLHEQHRYPEGGATLLREEIATYLDTDPKTIVCGNGSNELIELIARIFSGPGRSVLHGSEGFIVYRLAALHAGAEPIGIPMRPDGAHDLGGFLERIDQQASVVFVASPNNPTGGRNGNEELIKFIRDLPGNVVVVIDEAYVEYLDDPLDLRALIAEGYPLIATRTFSKIHGLAGYRVGYAYGRADLIGLISRNRDPFNVNYPGQEAARAALSDHDYVVKSRVENAKGMERLGVILGRFRLYSPESFGNFRLAKVLNGPEAAKALLHQGVIVRPLQPYGMFGHLRISVGTGSELDRLEEALAKISSETSVWKRAFGE